jgi:hypothetical protein
MDMEETFSETAARSATNKRNRIAEGDDREKVHERR